MGTDTKKSPSKVDSSISFPGAPEKSRELLLTAGKKVFATIGYDGATVKDITDAAGVNISLVSYYFRGKEGLYLACLEQFGRSRLEMAERVLQVPKSPEELRIRLTLFVEELLGCFVDEPEITKIIHREFELGLPLGRELFKDTFLKVFETFQGFLKAAGDDGLLKESVDTSVAATMIFGCVSHSARMDSSSRGFLGYTIQDPDYRRKLVDQITSVFLCGIIRENNP